MILLAALGLQSSILVDKNGSVGELYSECQAFYRAQEDIQKIETLDLIKAQSCISYVQGGYQIHATQNLTCDYGGATTGALIESFMKYVRKRGNMDAPKQAALSVILDTCYCGKNPNSFDYVCPTD